jgi:hypothetical protein
MHLVFHETRHEKHVPGRAIQPRYDEGAASDTRLLKASREARPQESAASRRPELIGEAQNLRSAASHDAGTGVNQRR